MKYLLMAIIITLLAGCGYLPDIDLDDLDFGGTVVPPTPVTPITQPAPTPESLPTPTQILEAEHYVYYIVEEDNTLWNIAALIYGDAERWGELYRANQEYIEDPGLIYKGQVLIIPNFDCSASFISDCYGE